MLPIETLHHVSLSVKPSGRAPLVLGVLTLAVGCSAPGALPTSVHELALAAGSTPLIDFTPGETYFGLTGGLYENGSNAPSPSHDAAGLAAAANVQPMSDRIVVLSIGMSNAVQEFQAFQRREGRPGPLGTRGVWVRGNVWLLNGARGTGDATRWDDPGDRFYNKARQVLAKGRLTEADVQVVWLKLAHSFPVRPLPDPNADTYVLAGRCNRVVDALRTRYPNLRQVFISSRSYGGYSTIASNPEPFAYEGGFAIRACILAREGRTDPWVGWGPYLWANGEEARSDGLTWLREDFEDDGLHPSLSGEIKVADLLADHFEQSPYATWYPEAP